MTNEVATGGEQAEAGDTREHSDEQARGTQTSLPTEHLAESSQPIETQSVPSDNIGADDGDGDSGLSDDLEDQDIDPYAGDEDFEIPSAQRKKKNKKTKKKDKTKGSYAKVAESKPNLPGANRLGVASPVAGRTRDKSVKRKLTLDFTLQ